MVYQYNIMGYCLKIQVDSLSTSVCSLAILNLIPSGVQFPPLIYIGENTLLLALEYRFVYSLADLTQAVVELFY
jgi:hypothetical protein